MNRGEDLAIIVGILFFLALGAGSHCIAALMHDHDYKEPYFKAIKENPKTNELSQIPANCKLQEPTAVRSNSEKETIIFTYVRTCKAGESVTADYLFAVCSKQYPFSRQFENESDMIQCQSTGWVKLHKTSFIFQ
jgi:hypothetical protein